MNRFFRWLDGGDEYRPPPSEINAEAREHMGQGRLGEHAKRLMADPVLLMAFDLVSKKLRDTWAASAPADTEGRERVHAELRGLGRVRGELLAMIGDVKLLEAEEKRREAEPRRL